MGELRSEHFYTGNVRPLPQDVQQSAVTALATVFQQIDDLRGKRRLDVEAPAKGDRKGA